MLEPTNPYAPPANHTAPPEAADARRGRVMFAFVVGAILLIEFSAFEISVLELVRLLPTLGLLYATWIGHNWARVMLGISAFLGLAVIGIMLTYSPGASAFGAAGLLLVTVYGAATLSMGSLLFWSRDLRAYLDTDKFPSMSDGRQGEEREHG